MICIMGLGFWLRDLIVLEWEITTQFANYLGYGIMITMIILCCFVIFTIIKLNRIITKFVSVDELESELNRIKKNN